MGGRSEQHIESGRPVAVAEICGHQHVTPVRSCVYDLPERVLWVAVREQDDSGAQSLTPVLPPPIGSGVAAGEVDDHLTKQSDDLVGRSGSRELAADTSQ